MGGRGVGVLRSLDLSGNWFKIDGYRMCSLYRICFLQRSLDLSGNWFKIDGHAILKSPLFSDFA